MAPHQEQGQGPQRLAKNCKWSSRWSTWVLDRRTWRSSQRNRYAQVKREKAPRRPTYWKRIQVTPSDTVTPSSQQNPRNACFLTDCANLHSNHSFADVTIKPWKVDFFSKSNKKSSVYTSYPKQPHCVNCRVCSGSPARVGTIFLKGLVHFQWRNDFRRGRDDRG